MQSKYTSTLNAISQQNPCEGGWKKLLKSLGKTKPDDEPLHLRQVLEAKGAAARAAEIDTQKSDLMDIFDSEEPHESL